MSFERVEDEREGKIFYEGDPRFAGGEQDEDVEVCVCGHVLVMHIDNHADLSWCRHGGCVCERWEREDGDG